MANKIKPGLPLKAGKVKAILSKTFKKGLKIGALTTAVLMGATACEEAAPEINPIQAYLESTIDYDQGLEQGTFLRHRFVEPDDNIDYHDAEDKKIAWSNKHYNDAKAYMIEKDQELRNKIFNQESYDNFLAQSFEKTEKENERYDTEKTPFANDNTQDAALYMTRTYLPLLGTIWAKAAVTQEGRNKNFVGKFQEHCLALLLRAYNDSLGTYAYAARLPFNQERDRINQDLSESVNGDYDLDDYGKIEDALWEMLDAVAGETGVDVETLKDVVNINLLHASLRGARDLSCAKLDAELSSKAYRVLPPPRADYNLTELGCASRMIKGYDDWIDTYLEEQAQTRGQQKQVSDTTITR